MTAAAFPCRARTVDRGARDRLAVAGRDLDVEEAELLAAAQQAGLRGHRLVDRGGQVAHVQAGGVKRPALGAERRARHRVGADDGERGRDPAVERAARVGVRLAKRQAQQRPLGVERLDLDAERRGVRRLGAIDGGVGVAHASGRRQE